jgi:hypothetical protein
VHAGIIRQNQLVVYKPVIASAAPESPVAVRQRMMRVAAPALAPKAPANDNHSQVFQKRHQDARDLTVKKQRMAADSADRERARLDKEAQREADQKKRATLKADASVQALRAQQARQHADKAEKWKQPEETPLPKVKKIPAQPGATVQKDLDKDHKALVKSVNAEAQAEKRKKKAIEDETRKQAEGEVQK